MVDDVTVEGWINWDGVYSKPSENAPSEADLKVRKCAICENELRFVEILNRNWKMGNDKPKEYWEKFWMDDRLQIPCCKCYTLLENISIGFSVYFGSEDGKIIKKNLQKWGVL